jgi:small subunit ribosomal protein S17
VENKIRILDGDVISTNGTKTATVKVEELKMHKLYGKRVKRSKKYRIHDEKEECKIGDVVSIVECRPYSKTKKFKLLKINKSVNSK